MSEKLVVRCPQCGSRFGVAAEFAGRRGKCRKCGNAFVLNPEPPAVNVPQQPSDAGFDEPDFSALAGLTSGPPAIDRGSVPSPVKRVTTPPRKFVWSEQSLLYKIGGTAVLVVLLAITAFFKYQSMQRRDRLATRLGERLIGADGPSIPPPKVDPLPRPPELVPPRPKGPLSVVPKLQFTDQGGRSVGMAFVRDRRARGTQVRLYLPPGTHKNGSVPCVFICPAGSNSLVGVGFDADEQETFFPLLDRGMAVCFYTLDGTVKDLQRTPPLVMAVAMTQYVQSEGGLNNLADAIDTVTAGAPSIEARNRRP